MTPIDFANYQLELKKLQQKEMTMIILTEDYLKSTSEIRKKGNEDYWKLRPTLSFDAELQESLEDINDMFKGIEININLPKPPQPISKEDKNNKSKPLF